MPGLQNSLPLALSKLPSDWDLLYLGFLNFRPTPLDRLTNWILGYKGRELCGDGTLMRIKGLVLGCECYAVSNAGARKLLAATAGGSSHWCGQYPDFVMSGLEHVNKYAVVPQCAFQGDLGFASSINISQVPAIPNYLLRLLPHASTLISPYPYDRRVWPWILSMP